MSLLHVEDFADTEPDERLDDPLEGFFVLWFWPFASAVLAVGIILVCKHFGWLM